ncbi:alpha/beta hydrolase [Deltaproteobacteria bacterium TL4]
MKRELFENRKGENFSFLVHASSNKKVPTLHFAHATGMNANTYTELLQRLSSFCSVYALDFRGHGLTTARAVPEKLISWDQYCDDLIPFLEQLETPVYLAGHSMGGTISMVTAALRPDLVKGLILIEPVLPSRLSSFILTFYHKLGLMKRSPIAYIAKSAEKRRPIFPSREAAIDNYLGKGAFKTWDRQWIEHYVNGGTRKKEDGKVELTCSPAWECQTFLSGFLNLWEYIPKIKCPILALYGNQNSTFEVRDRKIFRQLHDSAKMVLFEEATHFLPMEYTKMVTTHLEDFIMAQETRYFNP